jgi:hypothetical protein
MFWNEIMDLEEMSMKNKSKVWIIQEHKTPTVVSYYYKNSRQKRLFVAGEGGVCWDLHGIF